MISREIFDIDWQVLFFLRSEWLWGFVPLVVILALALLSNREKSSWKKQIAPHLRPHVFSQSSRSALYGPILGMLLFGSIVIVAASGPTWKKVDIPGAKSEAVLYIAMDMSRSMTANDIAPNRLERAKYKLRDLLEANPKARTGLMVFAGTAHPVISICEDYNLILNQIEGLTPYIMPRAGSNFQYAFDLIDTVMNRIEAPSTLLLISDELDETKAQYLFDFVENGPHRIELMMVSTAEGSKVPGWRTGTFFQTSEGRDYISYRNDALLGQLRKHPKISYTPLTLDKSDVQGIADRVGKNLVFRKDNEKSDEEWQDMGYYLIPALLLIGVFWFRKGFMIPLSVALIVTSCSEIQNWDNLWFTPDYQAQMLYDDEAYEDSAEKYESYFHKGVALYKSGDVESAIYFFQQDSLNPKSQYNLGLSYARLGYLSEAKEALEMAAEQDPDLPDIQPMLSKVEQQIIKTDSLARLTGKPKKKFPFEDKKNEPLKERKASGEDEELTSDTEVDKLPESGDRITDIQETGIRKAEELTEVPEDFQPGQGDNAQDVLLRKISADPSEFLKRKFEYQFKKHYAKTYEQGENW